MNRIAWTVNRLRCMSMAEVAYRVQTKLHTSAEALGFGLAKVVPPTSGDATLSWLQPELEDLDAEPYLGRADRVMAGRFDVFALEDLELGFPPQWNGDPKTGRVAPLSFGKTLNYRDEAVAGDIKYLWEINRHRELLWLAQAWYLTGEERYLDAVATLLRSWFEQCPYPLGVNWTSSLEHSVRLMHWSAAWSLLGGDGARLFAREGGEELRRAWLDSIFQHLHFIAGHFSLYSSSNNHLIGEFAGLFIGACTWPLWPVCEEWRRQAQAGLEAQTQRQNFPDGFNREQAIWYHHEVAELFFLCGRIGRAAGFDFSSAYWASLERMLEALALLIDPAGNVPALGDSDDAVYLELGLKREVYRNLLGLGALEFKRADFWQRAGGLPDRGQWLAGSEARQAFAVSGEAGPPNTPLPVALPDAGYWILGSRLHEDEEIRILADAGELGFLSIAAHGHADALAVLLSAAGRPILIDPGTYAYHTEAHWRRYFRGTSAHNTLEVDGQDQSLQAGNFMWLAHAPARLLQCRREGQTQIWEGEHSGYMRLSDPVVHRRRLIFDEAQLSLEVRDEIICQETHDVALHWHVDPNCDVCRNYDETIIAAGPFSVRLYMESSSLALSVHRGEDDPPLGWVSPRFDVKLPLTTLRFAGAIRGNTTLVTRIELTRQTNGS